MERIVNRPTDLQEDFNWVRTYLRNGGRLNSFLLAKDVTRHGSFWEGKNFYSFCLFYHKNLLNHKLFSFAVRVPFVSFILPYCALIIKSLMLKNSTWKNMFLRAWKHSLQCFLPLLLPQHPNQQVNFVFRLSPPPTQSLLWNINSFSGSKKNKEIQQTKQKKKWTYGKTARDTLLPPGNAIQDPLGVWRAGKSQGER